MENGQLQLDKLKNTLIEANRILERKEVEDNYNFGALKYLIMFDLVEEINKSNYDEDVFIDSVFKVKRTKSVLKLMIKDCAVALIISNNNRAIVDTLKILETLEDHKKTELREIINQL